MKNSHNLTGLLAESLVWLLLLVKDCWKSCFIGKTPTLYVFFRHHLRQDKNTFNARVLANVSEFFHHLVLQDGGEAIIPPILPVAAAHIKARKSPLCFRRSKAFERVMSTSTNTAVLKNLELWSCREGSRKQIDDPLFPLPSGQR